jgi:hemolysin activation/secretion protein
MAQQAPDAGRLLREQPAAPAKPAPRRAAPDKPAEAAPATGPSVLVKGFRIEGPTLIPAAELADQLKDFIGKQLRLSELRSAASRLVGYYESKGYVARVVVPGQNVADGIVALRVIEGRRGELRVEKKGERLDADRVRRFVERLVPAGQPLRPDALGEALSILNEQPGVSAEGLMRRGKGEGDVDISVTATETPLFDFGVQANNHGSRATGTVQGGLNVNVNNPSGALDQVAVLTNVSDGTRFGQLAYSLAAGDRGLRLGAAASRLTYRLTQDSFRALEARGTAESVRANASYPLMLREDRTLRLTGEVERRELVDRTVNGETGNRRVQVASVGLNGSANEALFGVGASSYGVTIHAGSTRQRNAAALATDRTSRNIEGSYSKLSYSLGHAQALTDRASLGLGLRGQFASKNLDSSERFSLGGVSGVRAYPTGEAIGDEGWLLTGSLNYRAADKVYLNAFVDHGSVRLNRQLWDNWNAANPRLENRYSLSGAGVGFTWTFAEGATLNFSVARRIGDNPGRDAAGNDADGTRRTTRAWLGVVAYF